MTLKTFAAAATMAILTATASSAATLNLVGGFSGGQLGDVAFDFTFSGDFTQDIAATSSGFTVNSFTSSVIAGNPFALTEALQFAYFVDSDVIQIGGGDPCCLLFKETDILFAIADFTTAAAHPGSVIDSLASEPLGGEHF